MKNRLLKQLVTEWNSLFPGENIYFAFQQARYSINYQGTRRKMFVYLKYFSPSLDKVKLALFCRRFNSKQILIEF